MAKGDYGASARLRPVHFTVAVREDGSANTSVGFVADVVNPDTSSVLASARNFEIELSPDERTSLTDLIRRLGEEAVAAEGLAGIAAAPAAATPTDQAAAAPTDQEPPPQG